MTRETNEIEYYKDPNGIVPFDEWINNLDDIKGRAIVRIRWVVYSEGYSMIANPSDRGYMN